MPGVRWCLHLRSAPERVWHALSTDDGRATFWAERTVRHDGAIEWLFPNGVRYAGEVRVEDPPHRFELDYLGNTTTFTLQPDGAGGTDLELVTDVPSQDYLDALAGWVSVLLALKASVDYGVDLRSHDSSRTWDQGYCDN